MDNLTDGLKKLLLAGVGAVALTADKSQEILDELVKKGELTVEQGKTLNQELKHRSEEKAEKVKAERKQKTMDELLASLSKEDLDQLKEKIRAKEQEEAGEASQDGDIPIE
jgi:polyhydroxyalkanoate synthesis regulator phasin